MTIRFSSNSTVQVPRLLLALGITVAVAGSISLGFSGSGSAVLLPAAVVFGMGLYYNGAKRYEVMEDKIRTIGILGQRDLPFEKVHGFEDAVPESFTSRLQSKLTGAPKTSAIEVKAEHSFWSRQNYLWVENREAFLSEARDALSAWRATRSIAPNPGTAPNEV